MAENEKGREIDFRGEVALVTGGGRGLGRAYAQALAAAGAAVAVTARTEAEIEGTAGLIESAGGQALAITADVAERSSVERTVARVERDFGPVSLLVNNAGITGPFKSTWEADPDEWWRTLEVNVRGSYLCARAVLPGMIESRRGRIIMVTSAGTGEFPFMGAYVASKHAQSTIAQTLAGEVAGYGIVAFTFWPGFVRTVMTEWAATSPEVHPTVRKNFGARLDSGRQTSLEHSTNMLMQLASGKLDALSGRYVSVIDDFDELISSAEEIRRDNLFLQRRTTFAREGDLLRRPH